MCVCVRVCLEKKWQTDVVLLSDGSFSLSPHQYSLVDVSVVAVVYLFFLLDGHTHTFATNSLSLTQARACNKREGFNPLLSPLFFSFSSLSPSPSPSSPQRAITLTYLLLLDSLPFFFSLSLSLTAQAFRDRRTAQIIRSLSARVLLHISSLFVLFRRVRERERERRNFADVIDRAIVHQSELLRSKCWTIQSKSREELLDWWHWVSSTCQTEGNDIGKKTVTVVHRNECVRFISRSMLTHHHHLPSQFKQQSDHDLTELSWLTQSDIFDRSSSSSSSRSTRPIPIASETLPIYASTQHRHRSSPLPASLIDSSDSEHDNDSSSLNSSSERVTTSTDIVSPPHSALCFWILFAIEDSRLRALTLNEICDWIEHHIEQSTANYHQQPSAGDDHSIQSARLKSKIRYHMTKQISFFVKIIKDPRNGMKLRYPLWTTDRSKRLLLLDTLLTMNTRQLSLVRPYTIEIFERLCSERRQDLLRQTNDENSCPLAKSRPRDKTIHRLGSCEETGHVKRKKQRSRPDPSTSSGTPSVEVVDAAMTLLLLRQPKWHI